MSGRGSLRVERSGGKSAVHTARAEAPLKLLLPNNHGDAAWVFVATLGGGLVGGDAIALDVDVATGASAFVGTQSSTKVFRSDRETTQALRGRVADDATLVVVPDPVAPFAGARYRQTTEIVLGARATLVLVEIVTCGRAARGERWDLARYASRTRVERAGRLVAFDSLLLDAAHGDLRARLHRFEALATIVAVGPRADEVRASLLAEPPTSEVGAALLGFARPLAPDVAFLRVAATRVELATRRVRHHLATIGRLLGDDPFARRW
jgi:urease accessory protein